MDEDSVGSLLGSLAFVRSHHCYGQLLRNVDISVEDHADHRKLEKIVAQQMIKFLQAQVGGSSARNQDLNGIRCGIKARLVVSPTSEWKQT